MSRCPAESGMDSDTGIALILLLLGLGGAAFAAAASAALPAPRVRRAPNGERTALEWAVRERSVLGVTTLAVSAAGVALTSGGVAWLLYRGVLDTWASLLATAALAAVLVWLTQAVPSAMVASAPESALRSLLLPLRAAHLLLTPIGALYGLAVRAAAALVPGAQARARAGVAEDQELESIVEEIGEETADLEEQERAMIRGIIGMDSTTARMIMVPRMDIIAAEAEADLDEVVELVGRYGYSRIPIYEETIDNIVGIVYAKDLLGAAGSGGEHPAVRGLSRPPYFVPESKKVDELLREFQEQRTHVAVVVDEYGGTAGLVTLEDLLEEIVGEIQDEYERGERAERPIDRVSETEAVLDARVSIDDLNDLFQTEIEHEGYDTVGGLVYAHLGKIPNAGDQVQVNGLTISVVSTVGRRIKKVRAVHTAAEEPRP